MEFSGLGGGIMVALAAGLWLVYLIPTWFKRRDYVATEQNEVRRQQALRILKETTPVPRPAPSLAPVADLVDSTGTVKDRARLAETIKRAKEAQSSRMASRRLQEAVSAPAQEARVRALASRRLRRTRAIASLLLVAALGTLVTQGALMVFTGVAAESWAVLGFALVAGVVSVSALGRLASVARRRAAAPQKTFIAQPLQDHAFDSSVVVEPIEESITSWTPVPVPKPMYLSRSEASPAASIDPVEQLRAAARESDAALRVAHESPEVTSITAAPSVVAAASVEASEADAAASAEPAAPAAPPSRWASMGILNDSLDASTNLDEVLRRRRAAS